MSERKKYTKVIEGKKYERYEGDMLWREIKESKNVQ